MTDNNSDSGASNSGSAGVESKNKTAKMSQDQAFAEIENYKRIVAEKDAVIVELTQQLNEANEVLEGQEKGRLIGEILPLSSFKMEELVGKSAEELKNIRRTLDQAMPPKVNSVRFGVFGADLSDRERGLTVGDLSYSTAQKRAGKT